MKNVAKKKIVFIVTILIVLPLGLSMKYASAGTKASNTSRVRAEIQTKLNKINKMQDHGSISQILAVYHETMMPDAITTFADGKTMDQAHIEQATKKVVDHRNPDVSILNDTETIFRIMVDGDTAIVWSTQKITGFIQNEDGHRQNYSTVSENKNIWHRTASGWRISWAQPGQAKIKIEGKAIN